MISNNSVNTILVHGEPEAYLSSLGDDEFCRQFHMTDILQDLQGLWKAIERQCLIFPKYSLINGIISKTRKTSNIVVITYLNVRMAELLDDLQQRQKLHLARFLPYRKRISVTR
jgi:hypothetical protein